MATDYRSKSYSSSYRDGNMMQIEPYYGPASTRPGDFRSYSVSYAADNQEKVKKSKSGRYLNDPEFRRKRRVASYKVYSVEGKVKGSFRKSFRWIKDRYTQVLYAWW